MIKQALVHAGAPDPMLEPLPEPESAHKLSAQSLTSPNQQRPKKKSSVRPNANRKDSKPKTSKSKFQTPAFWIKFGLGIFAASLVIGGVWIGVSYISEFVGAVQQSIDNNSAIGSQIAKASPETNSKPVDNSTVSNKPNPETGSGENGGKTPAIDVVDESEATSGPDLIAISRFIREVNQNRTAIDIGPFAPGKSISVFEINGPKEVISTLQLSIDTFARRFELTKTDSESVWSLNYDIDGKPTKIAEIEFLFRDVASTISANWKWIDPETPSWMIDQILAGRLTMASDLVPREAANFSLCTASPETTVAAQDFISGPVSLNPHLSEFFKNTSTFQRFSWSISRFEIVDFQDINESKLFLPQKFNDQGDIEIKIDRTALEDLVFSTIGNNDADPESLRTMIRNEITYHDVNGFLIRKPSFQLVDEEFQFTGTIYVQIYYTDVNPVNLNQLHQTTEIKRSDRKRIRFDDLLVSGLMENLNISGKDEWNVVSSGGKGWKKLKPQSQQIKAVIGGIMYDETNRLLKSNFSVEISRANKTNSEQPRQFEVVAIGDR
ncbi:MAG: hypothetical protein R3C03_08085 [Pirellulaceae bacterium]